MPFYKEAKKWQVICKEFDQRAEKMMQRLEILGACQVFHAISVYLGLPDMQNFCLLVGFWGEKAEILHTWKIQVFPFAGHAAECTGEPFWTETWVPFPACCRIMFHCRKLVPDLTAGNWVTLQQPVQMFCMQLRC